MGKKSTPAQPAQPDPRVVAQAQTQSNVETGISNSVLQNANQYGPYGSTTFAENPGGGRWVGNNWIPQYNQTTTLSPNQQAILNQGEQLDLTMGNVAQNQANLIGDRLGTPYAGPSGDIRRSISGSQDWSADRKRVEDALFARLNPQLERTRDQLNTRLENQGFVRGGEGFNAAMDEANRQENDARLAVIGAGGQEQSRLAGLDFQAGQFQNQAYDQALKNELAIRNQPINEVSALTSGSQVSLPSVQAYQGGQVAATPVGDYYMQAAQMANANYQSQLQAHSQQMAGLYGGIGSLAGAGLYGAFRR